MLKNSILWISLALLVGCGGGYDAALARYETALSTVEKLEASYQAAEDKWNPRIERARHWSAVHGGGDEYWNRTYIELTAEKAAYEIPLEREIAAARERLEDAKQRLNRY